CLAASPQGEPLRRTQRQRRHGYGRRSSRREILLRVPYEPFNRCLALDVHARSQSREHGTAGGRRAWRRRYCARGRPPPSCDTGGVNMAPGAGHAGGRPLCATSGGGFARMREGPAMSAMMETPVVVIDCQRAGPATGVPTKTEQGDLWQMLGAAFGDYPRAIAAPLDITDCFKLIPEMFNLVDRFQCPGLVLCDLLLSEGRLSVDPKDLDFSPPIDRGELITD